MTNRTNGPPETCSAETRVDSGCPDVELLRTLFDQSFELIGLLTPEGRLLDANQTALTMIGAKREDVLGLYFWDTPWWDELEKTRLREAVARAACGEFVRYKTQHTDPDGMLRAIDFSLKPFRDLSGVVQYLIPEGRDITELTHTATELARLAAIVESSEDAIISLTVDGVIQSWNKGANQLYGYAAHDAVGKAVLFLSPPEESDVFFAMLQRAVHGEVISQFQTTRVCEDGSRVHVAVTLSPATDPVGKVIGISSVERDITEVIAAAKELERGNRMLKAISKAQSEFIAGAHPQVLFEEMLKNLLDLTQSEYGFIGEVFHDPAGTPYIKAHAITNIAWNDETRLLYETNAAKGLEFRNLHTLFGAVLLTRKPVIANDPATDPRRGGLPPGHPALKAFLGMPFFSGNKMIGTVGLANRPGGYDQDMVDSLSLIMNTCGNIIEAYRIDLMRQQAERALLVSEAKLRGILDSAVDGIITIDVDKIIQSFNPSAEKLFGYTADEVTGRNVKMLMPPPYSDEHDRFVDNYLNTNVPKIIGVGREVFGLRKDGSVFPLELSVGEVNLSDGKMFTGIVRDITERKKMERLKREFVSTVSHELRTPLTSIHGSLGLLQGGAAGTLDTPAATLVSIARNNTGRLIKLINDILDLEKLESEKMLFKMEPVALKDVISSSIEDNMALAQEKGIGYSFRMLADDVFVLGDKDRLGQVMANLISNAVKYSPTGGHVDISLAVAENQARVEVADQGPGVPEEFRGMIFEKFAQADSSDTRRRGGTGLGLSISKGIVEKLGGTIGFDTAAGGGASFHFILPLFSKDAPKGASASPANRSPDMSAPNTAHILHVDDDQDILDVVSLILRDMGDVTQVRSVAEAKKLLSERHFDLVVLDVLLPDGSGMELLRDIGAVPTMIFSIEELPPELTAGVGSVLLKSKSGNDTILAEAKRLLGLNAA